MKYIRLAITITFLLAGFFVCAQSAFTWSHGAIIRGDSTQKKIALVFSADEFAEGTGDISQTLTENRVRASFFFTGNFFKSPANTLTARKLLRSGNYIGSHSYGHLLYCDWTNRDSLLVTMDEFLKDMKKSYRVLGKLGISKEKAHYFLPPYEWYNDTVASWTKDFGLQLINFSPGTYNNADYTTPDMGSKYLRSDTIYNRILRYESSQPAGLNGFILLLHAGIDPARSDKFYHRLPSLIQELKSRGYDFVTIDELLRQRDHDRGR